MCLCLCACTCVLLCAQLNKKLQRLQTRLSRSSIEVGSVGGNDSPDATSAAAAAAAADGFNKTGPDAFAQQQHAAGMPDGGPFASPGAQYYAQQHGAYGKSYPPTVDYGQVPAKGWYLHACVVMAALGVRWWLLNQTDPLQRKVMLVIIWPVSFTWSHMCEGCMCVCDACTCTCACDMYVCQLGGSTQARTAGRQGRWQDSTIGIQQLLVRGRARGHVAVGRAVYSTAVLGPASTTV